LTNVAVSCNSHRITFPGAMQVYKPVLMAVWQCFNSLW